MPRQNGQGAIVTGASRGIGAAVAQRLASDGFNVVINYAGRPEEAEAQVASIRQSGGTAVAVRADVSNPAEMRLLFDEAEEQFGHVDVLVNNARIMQLSTFADADDVLFDRHIAVNLKSVFNGMREYVGRTGRCPQLVGDTGGCEGGCSRWIRQAVRVSESSQARPQTRTCATWYEAAWGAFLAALRC